MATLANFQRDALYLPEDCRREFVSGIRDVEPFDEITIMATDVPREAQSLQV